MRRGPVGVAVVAVVLVFSSPAAIRPAPASHLQETGFVHTGVPHEEAAREYNCDNADGGWDRTGPVVCVGKHADVYTVQIETDDADCRRRGDSWEGTCVFDIDMDDHVRIWGVTGVPYTRFVVDFGHGTTAGNGGRPAPARRTTSTTRPPGAGSPPSPTGTTPATATSTTTTVAVSATVADGGTSTTADGAEDAAPDRDDVTTRPADSPANPSGDDSAMPILVLVATLTAVGAAAIGFSRWRAPDA